MNRNNKFHFDANWYDLWMKQSKEFFDSANINLKDAFTNGAFVHPEEHLVQIHQWLESLKHQWSFIKLNEEQASQKDYWNVMMSMCNEASDLMLKEWIRRAHENNPVKNVRDLYELWLNCCQEVYQKSVKAKSYQETYSEFMNAAFKLWDSSAAR